MSVLSSNGAVLYQSSATTSVPVGEELPLIVQNVYFRDSPTKISYSLEEGRSFREVRDRINDISSKVVFNNSQPTIAYVLVKNNTKQALPKLPVRVVAYNADMRPVAVGETAVSRLSPGSNERVFVTFGKALVPEPFVFKTYFPLNPYEKVE